jgi:hypothetical protein
MFYYKKKDMYIFTPEEKAEAHNISVIDYLQQNYGLSFKKIDGGYRCEQHNSLFVHKDERNWYWNSQGYGGGDVVEFVRKYENKSFEEALITVLKPTTSSSVDIKYNKAPEPIEKPEKRELLLPPKKDGKYSNVFAYLTKTRCIDADIVTTLLHKKFIYQDSRNNVVFVGYNKAGLPAYASIRTTSTEHKYRKEAIGSDKNNGFYLRGFNKNTVYVFEAPVDLLSHATIANISNGNNREWLNSTRLSLGGVCDNALEHFLSENQEINNIVFCLDNDPAGIKATDKYMIKYADKGYTVKSEPPKAKDYNDDLKNMIKNYNAVAPMKK